MSVIKSNLTEVAPANIENIEKSRLIENYKKVWKVSVFESQKCLNYRILSHLFSLKTISVFCHLILRCLSFILDPSITNFLLNCEGIKVLKEMTAILIYACFIGLAMNITMCWNAPRILMT